jgi:NAD(P)-dependent dehydrogenase (short-subunit alcohol dehydrogenase family)
MKTAVITGTSTGIGLATSLHLAANGYRVFAGMRNLAKAQPLRDAASKDRLPIDVIEFDVTSQDSCDRAFAKVGTVDVLVNNAGIGGASPLELTPEPSIGRCSKPTISVRYAASRPCCRACASAVPARS